MDKRAMQLLLALAAIIVGLAFIGLLTGCYGLYALVTS